MDQRRRRRVVNKDNGRDGLADESTFDNPVTHEVYTWIKEMVDEGLLQGHSATTGQINQYLAVAQQNSSMMIETVDRRDDHQGRARRRTSSDVGVDDRDDVDLSKIVPVDAAVPRCRGAGPGARVGRRVLHDQHRRRPSSRRRRGSS